MTHVNEAHLADETQQLDGIEFKNSTFRNVTFEYSGGAFILTNDPFSTPMRVNLKGAAANTVGLIALVQSLNEGAKPAPLSPNAPVVKTASETHTLTVSLSSPYQK
jgi:hypothetical protein